MSTAWPDNLQVVRVARPTDQLQEIERFYCEGIGLRKLGSFQNHNGYDGLLVGLPSNSYHLEFTQHAGGTPAPHADAAGYKKQAEMVQGEWAGIAEHMIYLRKWKAR